LDCYYHWSKEHWNGSPVFEEMVENHAKLMYIGNMTKAAESILARLEGADREFLAELRQIVSRVVAKFNWTDRESAADIAQDCFLKIITNLRAGKFEGRSSFKTYVYVIVRRTCIDYYRAATSVDVTPVESVTLVDQTLSPEERIIGKERRRIAARILMALPKECRRLWRSVFFGRKTYRQVADHLGVKEGTIKRRMWECRQMAREKMVALER